jgi:hypothetical protein
VVSHDVRKLELRKLREALSTVVDETFGLENRKAQVIIMIWGGGAGEPQGAGDDDDDDDDDLLLLLL